MQHTVAAPDISASTLLEFSGDLRERPQLSQESLAFVARNCHLISIASIDERLINPFCQVHIQLRSEGGFTLVSRSRMGGFSGRSRITRNASQIGADGRDRFQLVTNFDGSLNISQMGRSQSLTPGTLAFVAESEPTATEASNDHAKVSGISFMMPRELIDHQLSAGQRYCLRPCGGSAGFQRLVLDALCSFGQNAWSLTREEFLTSAKAVTDLLLLGFEGSPDPLSGEHCVRTANLTRVKRIIRNRLAEPDLTLADIAREAGASLSYLHRLFRAQGQTMYEYLKDERLLRARALLQSSPSHRKAIADVFLQCGFSDKSYFSRAFKQKFGLTPGEAASRPDLKL